MQVPHSRLTALRVGAVLLLPGMLLKAVKAEVMLRNWAERQTQVTLLARDGAANYVWVSKLAFEVVDFLGTFHCVDWSLDDYLDMLESAAVR